MLSRRLLESSANEDIVVSEPQNPTAAKREYLPSRFHCCDTMINAPRINAPITLTNRTLTGNVLKSKGDSVSLYLKNAQVQILLQEKQIPNLSSISYTPTDVISAIWEN